LWNRFEDASNPEMTVGSQRVAHQPFATTLELNPTSRFDLIDVSAVINRVHGDVLAGFRRVLYCSHHTTAGYLEQRLAHRMRDLPENFDPFIRAFQQLFPRGAGYRHDDLELRAELSNEERRREPPNGDAHLTFMGSGLQSCVTYRHEPGMPVFFMDLDGVYRGEPRKRVTSVVAYGDEEVVVDTEIRVPVSHHTIDSVNLGDSRFGLTRRIDEMLQKHRVASGRIDISLDPGERSAGVTVNEYETLLMRHDLAEVLRDPFRFMARQGRRMLRDPRAVPAKSIGYARYDMVRVINRLLDVVGLADSPFEHLLARLLAIPAERRLRFKRSLSLPIVSDRYGRSRIVSGRFQTPILIQWAPAANQLRRLKLQLIRFF
jgi:thiamine phosphate synthase YjbQ (UPF0047 family)